MPSVPFLSTLKFDVVAFGPVVKPSLIHFNLVASTQWQNFGKRMILSVFFASSMELSWQHISPIPNSIRAADILAAATRRRCEEDPVMPTCLKSVYDIKTRCSAWGQCQQLGFLVGSKPYQKNNRNMKVPQFLWVPHGCMRKKQSIMPSECMELFSLKYTVVVDTTALKTHSHIDRFKETHTTIADSSPMVLWYMAMLQWPAQATWKVTFFLIWGHSNAVGFCRQGLQYFDREIQQVERWTLTWERWGGQAVLVAKLQCSSNNSISIVALWQLGFQMHSPPMQVGSSFSTLVWLVVGFPSRSLWDPKCTHRQTTAMSSLYNTKTYFTCRSIDPHSHHG